MPAEANWAGNLTYRRRRRAPPRRPRGGAGPRRPVPAGARGGHPALLQRGRGPPGRRARLPVRLPPQDHGRRRRDDRVGGRRHPVRRAGGGAGRPGCALHNMGSLPHISVAGATATGTHGSGDGNGVLATAVRALESSAPTATCRRGPRRPGARALAVGLGAFGVITGSCSTSSRPTGCARTSTSACHGMPRWSAVDEVMAGAYSVSLMGDPGALVG